MITTMGAHYDGLAEWYDTYNAPAAAANASEIADLLGLGHGLCLDLGCGTGQYLEAIEATGRTVVGLDRSGDQLRLARAKSGAPLLQGDAAAIPFADQVFDTVTMLWISTDVDDFPAVTREAARLLRPGGTLLFYGVHPCFNGPHVQIDEATGGLILHPIYRRAEWHEPQPWWRPGGVRERLGVRHVPLAELLTAIASTGLVIELVREPREQPLPYGLAVRARRAA